MGMLLAFHTHLYEIVVGRAMNYIKHFGLGS
jgi:hypothetical protein